MWHTRRLTIARVNDRSAEGVSALISHPTVQCWLRPDAWQPVEIDTPDQQAQRFAVSHASDEQFIGMFRIDGHQLSYAVVPDLWGHGLGTELVGAACELIAPDLGLDYLEARVERDNVRSRRLLEASGFRFRGISRDAEWKRLSVLSYYRRMLLLA